jgi:hypothetical protein
MKNGIILEEWVGVICPAVGSTIGQDFWSNLYYCGFQKTFLNNLYKCDFHQLEWPSTSLSDLAPTNTPSKKSSSGISWMGWRARVYQQPPMHQLAVLPTGWAAFFHSTPNGVHHKVYFFLLLTTVIRFFFFFFVLGCFSLGPDLTHSYPAHLLILISSAPTNLGTLLIIPYWHSYPNY